MPNYIILNELSQYYYYLKVIIYLKNIKYKHII